MPYSPITPLSTDYVHGKYTSSERMKQVAFQNLKTIALTNPGERHGNRNFGIGIKNKLFAQDTPALRTDLRARIANQIARYCPYVRLLSVHFSPQNDAVPTLSIGIRYVVLAGACASEDQEITITGDEDGGTAVFSCDETSDSTEAASGPS